MHVLCLCQAYPSTMRHSHTFQSTTITTTYACTDMLVACRLLPATGMFRAPQMLLAQRVPAVHTITLHRTLSTPLCAQGLRYQFM